MNRAPKARMLGSTALVACLIAACADERTVVTDPIGPLSFDFLVPTSIARLPSGSTAGQAQDFISATASDLGGGADFNFSLVGRYRTPTGFAAIPEAAAVETVTVAAGATQISFAFTPPGIPGRDGFSGPYTANLTVGGFSGTGFINGSVVLNRVDATGAVLASTAATAEQAFTTGGVKAYAFAAGATAALGTWSTGDRLRVDYRLRNADGANPQFVVVATGSQAVIRPTRSLTLTLSNLPALSGTARYQFWVMGRDAANLDVPVAAYGRLVEFFSELALDSLGNPIPGPTGDPLLATDSTTAGLPAGQVAEYAGSADSATSWVRVIIDSTADNGNPVAYHAVFVTREDAPATSPGPVRFLWRRTGLAAADVQATMLFGHFGGSDLVNLQSPADYVYNPIGAGTGGARGPELSVDFREIPRPPIGFFYRGVILDANGQNIVVDTLRSAYNTDPTLSRVSLYDADIDPLLPGIAGTSIRTSQVRNCAAGSGATNCQNTLALPTTATFVGMAKFQLKLEPKGNTATLSNVLVSHAGDLPDEVKQ